LMDGVSADGSVEGVLGVSALMGEGSAAPANAGRKTAQCTGQRCVGRV
jgi:hypothetical protein